MREILFKAKRIDNGEWVEGYYSKSPDPMLAFLKDFIFAPYFDEKTECGYDNGYRIDPNTICQFTGLYDSTKWEDLSEKEQRAFLDEGNLSNDWKGKKIWENDVCQYTEADECGIKMESFVVRYGRKVELFRIDIGFFAEWIENSYYRCDLGFWAENRNIEVIGNIFDNPEFLEGEQP